jgi:DHA1 family bicyclomycin/chloramphenicol resistance-like MFS transporter
MPSDLRLLPKHFFFVVLLMVPITGMGIDLYAPSLPWIVKALHTTPAMVKLTLPMYLIGYSFGSLLFGPISDSYGRKLTVYVG